jgi:iron(III) transport system substrate-binding protein
VPLRSPRSLVLPVALVGVALTASGCGITSGLGDEALQVYSARSYGAEEAYRTFTEDTGIEVEFLNGNDAELRERLAAEGEDSPADVYLTVDVANLSLAAEQDLLQPIESSRAGGGGAGAAARPRTAVVRPVRAGRVIIYDEDEVDPSELSTYAALGDPRWRGELCLRTSTSAYTQSLVASMIAHDGPDAAAEVVEGWMANDPQIFANDNEIVRTVGAGGCCGRRHQPLLRGARAGRGPGPRRRGVLPRPVGQRHAREHQRCGRHPLRR